MRLLVLFGALAVMALGPLGVAASAALMPTAIDVTVVPAEKAAVGYVVNARIRAGAQSTSPGAVSLSFYVVGDLFGPRDVDLGKATTDTQGRASVTYLPSWSGEQQIKVRFAGNDQFAGSEGRTSFTPTLVKSAPRTESSPLAEFSSRVPYVVGAVVLGVWLAIAFALLNTVRGIARQKGDIA